MVVVVVVDDDWSTVGSQLLEDVGVRELLWLLLIIWLIVEGVYY